MRHFLRQLFWPLFFIVWCHSASLLCADELPYPRHSDKGISASNDNENAIVFRSDSLVVTPFYEPHFRYSMPERPPVSGVSFVSTKTSGLHPGRFVFTVGGLASANYFAYRKFKNIWWNYNKTSFHLYRGWRQTEGWYDFGPDDSLWHHMDKFGHFYCTRLLSLMLSDMALWVGFDENSSRWIGAATSWLFYLQIEIFDGQFEQWGFSLGDLTANTAGAFMPVLSQQYPLLQEFTLKLSYSPGDGQPDEYMIDDYSGMTFWLASNPQHFMPRFFDDIWPDFLNLAFGYSVSQKARGDIELYFGLDYDLSKIQTRSPFWNRVLYYINFIHFPAPAIKFKPNAEYYLLYY